MVALRCGWRKPDVLRASHRWAAYAAGYWFVLELTPRAWKRRRQETSTQAAA